MATIFYTAASLDGFLATTEHSLDWLLEVPGGEEAQESPPGFLASIGALAMGSSTYEWVVDHESLMDHPQTWTQWYGDRPAWVFTHRDLRVVEGAQIRFTEAPVRQVHAEMVAGARGKDIWLMGGGDLAGQFADAGLLDRIIVTIAPVTLGAGAPLLTREIHSDRLALTGVTRLGQFVQLSYELGPPS